MGSVWRVCEGVRWWCVEHRTGARDKGTWPLRYSRNMLLAEIRENIT